MALKWLCTGRDEHTYNYKTADGVAVGTLVCLNFKAEIDSEGASGAVNELHDTKAVLTEAGVEGLFGLIPYAQGFTVLYDTRLSNVEEEGAVVTAGELSLTGVELPNFVVGAYLQDVGSSS